MLSARCGPCVLHEVDEEACCRSNEDLMTCIVPTKALSLCHVDDALLSLPPSGMRGQPASQEEALSLGHVDDALLSLPPSETRSQPPLQVHDTVVEGCEQHHHKGLPVVTAQTSPFRHVDVSQASGSMSQPPNELGKRRGSRLSIALLWKASHHGTSCQMRANSCPGNPGSTQLQAPQASIAGPLEGKHSSGQNAGRTSRGQSYSASHQSSSFELLRSKSSPAFQRSPLPRDAIIGDGLAEAHHQAWINPSSALKEPNTR
ncbi:hypothetical protein DUNSADRAFT_13690 [Dunaliella salina]|uniref:Encoded protein n=1 Tax=Dunaliella salina TaxID=3046 RepID=A0ABQ7G8V9_DUNSA|nr:hypothetical protein DUNSADRAFT_13690 [Dunaliella salina]|eukprot:KAF5831021.1 hypothetical protein DUNSADRAFT_13690 [Dunaliella salina]